MTRRPRPDPIILKVRARRSSRQNTAHCLREEAIDQGDGMNTTDFQTQATAQLMMHRRGRPASRRTASLGASVSGLQRQRMQRLAMSDCHRAQVLRPEPTGDMPPPTGRASQYRRRIAPPQPSATGSS